MKAFQWSSMVKRLGGSRWKSGAALVVIIIFPTVTNANNLSLSNVPLFLGTVAEPNVMFTLDDSGSMGWEVMPDALTSISNNSFPTSNRWTRSGTYDTYFDSTSANVAQIRSPDVNTIYYNPTIRYYPWSNSDATLMANASTTCADYDPMNPNTGTCVNFTTQKSVIANDGTTHTVWPADYYSWDGVGSKTNIASYTHVVIQSSVTSYTGGANRTDCASAPTCTYAEEIQNFANWFQYYRERLMTAKAGVGRVFAAQPVNLRVGYGTINTTSHTVDGVSTRTVKTGVRHFSGTNRTTFFTNLYNDTTSGSTPLRQALNGVGQYFMRTDNAGPWGNTPGDNTDTTAHSACRQSYNIMMTDGYWNGSNPSVTGNIDNTNGPTISSPSGSTYQYTPSAPYQDSYSTTLADVAMYYWNHDLRSDLSNVVPTNAKDVAFWQHLVNFTVGLGVNGLLDPATDWAGLQAGTTSWPQASNHQIDDLWHAAVNSRGGYYSAANPDEFTTALSNTFVDILGRETTTAPVAINNNQLSVNQVIYQSRFDSGTWTGTVKAIPYNVQTNTMSAPQWNAQAQVTAQNWNTGRHIVTYVPGTGGAAFRWASLSSTQQAALNINPATGTSDGQGSLRLDFVRGRGVATFRSRPAGVLGDIINSAPVYVGAPDLFYPDYWGTVPDPTNPPNGVMAAPENAHPYSAYISTQAGRAGRVYVGANDGMMHVLDPSTGNEVYAYIPNKVIQNLNRLTDPAYVGSHRYFVDGTIQVSDVFFASDSSWHTVLVGALRGGGQGIYALDITNPAAANETAASAKVLWEFTDANDADLGYTYGDISIERMHDGSWAVIFGNGYNNMEADGHASTTGDSVIYVVNVETGALIKKLDTGNGVNQSTNTPRLTNGMASPGVADVNSDGIADYIYAGDLQGNLWKYDVTSSDKTNWKSSYLTTGNAAMPMFKATDSAGVSQPITSGVDIGPQPSNYPGYMVYVGTGRLLELGDNSGTGQQTQTLYGVWDRTGGGMTQPTSSITRNHLKQQTILSESLNTSGIMVRALSTNPIAWDTSSGLPTGTPPTTQMGWYMDLVNTGVTPLNNKGERVIVTPSLENNAITFTTMLPSSDPCVFGGESWIMIINPADGGQHPHAESQKSQYGLTGGPVTTRTGNLTRYIVSGTNGMGPIDGPQGTPVQGRQSWIRLR